MREILFRAKSIDNDEWIYGAFIPDLRESLYGNKDCDGFIKPFGKTKEERLMVEIDRETVCQYTGLKDWDGKNVFEGDFICCDDRFHKVYGIVRFGRAENITTKGYNLGFYIEWQDDGANLWSEWQRNDIIYWVEQDKCTVIGNIFDNKELLDD